MSIVEAVGFDLAVLHNRALDSLGKLILGAYGVNKLEKSETMVWRAPHHGETATASSATETRPPDVKNPS